MTTDLEKVGRISKVAALATLASSAIVIGALLFGYAETNRAIQEARQLTATRDSLREENAELSKKRDALINQREKLKQEINAYIESGPHTAVVSTSIPTIAGQPVKIYIYIADTRNIAEAQRAAQLLKDRGYIVEGIRAQPLSNSPHETTVRFFQYDRSTVSQGKELVRTLQGIGFNVRTEFDDEFVGASPSPPPGTFDFWIGTNPSYSPKA